MQLAVADADVAGSGEQLVQQGSPLLIGTGVVRSQQRKQIALGLIGNHLDDVGQVLSFGGELDDSLLVADLGPRRVWERRGAARRAAPRERELCVAACRACHGRS